MKKIISLILCVALLLSFSACGLLGEEDSLKDVSDLRIYYLVGNSDNYYAEIFGGLRESPLVVDGSCGKTKEYIKIKVLPKSGVDGEYKYHIGINEEEFDGTLSKEIGGGYYTATISAKELDKEYKLTITCGDKKEIITMKTCISETMIDYKEARTIAESELKEKIHEMKKGEEEAYEVYIKFIEGEIGTKQYFWYVAFMTDKEICAVLIDPVSKKIVAKRN